MGGRAFFAQQSVKRLTAWRAKERDVPFYVLRAANGNPKTALGRWMETLRRGRLLAKLLGAQCYPGFVGQSGPLGRHQEMK